MPEYIPSCSTPVINLTTASMPEYPCVYGNDSIPNEANLSKNKLDTLKGFRIAHLNITSLPKYIDQLRTYLVNKPVDIFTINETRLDESINDVEVNIEGYNLYRRDRCRHGGGVAIYTRDVLNVREMSPFVPENIEAVCLEIIKPKSKPILLTTVYRPPSPNASFMDDLENYFHILDEQDKELILTGDLNCDLSLPVLQSHSRRLMDILELFQMNQVITAATRITGNTDSLLDIIATNRPDKVKESGVFHLGISDHSLVYMCLKISLPREKPKIVESRNLKNYNINDFNNHISHLLSNAAWNHTDPDQSWDQFKNIFNYVSDIYAPIKTRKVKSTYAPWLTTEIRCEMNKRDYLKKRAVKSNSKSLHRVYKAKRNEVNKLIRSAKFRYCKDNINLNKHNPKEMWKNINHVISGKGRYSKTTTISAIKDDLGNTIHDEKLIADQLNKYFVEIGPKLSNKLPASPRVFSEYLDPVDCEFQFLMINDETVYKKIMKLKPNKGAGLDKIPQKLIKDSAVVITPYLNLIFNLSLSEGKFPDDWKKARVSPIFKSGNREECGNYRPISILSAISKIFEKIVFDQLSQYLITNKILNDYQSGFRKGYSTCSSLLRTTNEWLVNMDKGLINGVVFLDLKKAFDTVDHNILIKKLEFYGLKNNTLRWFISYLCHRKQICKVGMSVSNSENITTGVPQGSNLGPLLFLLYINDLPNCLDSSVPALFADDTNLTTSGSTASEIQDNLEIELNKVHTWLLANKLTLNVDKTEYMLIGSRQRLSQVISDPILSMGSEGIKRTLSTKTLGVVVDECLTWKDHIDKVAKKAAKGIGMLRRSKHLFDTDTLKTIYSTFVLPHFDYCSLVWNNCSKTLQNKLQKLQNKAGRIITGDCYETASEIVRTKLSWDTLEARREKQLETLMIQIMKGNSTDYLHKFFTICTNQTYELRSNNHVLHLPKPNTNALKRSFSYKGAAAWNNIEDKSKF